MRLTAQGCEARRGPHSRPAADLTSILTACKEGTCSCVRFPLERAAIVETLLPQKLGSGQSKNQDTKKCHEMGLESSSGAENTTKMHSKTSPTQLEGSRGPNSDPKIRDFHAEKRPVKSPPASTIARPP